MVTGDIKIQMGIDRYLGIDKHIGKIDRIYVYYDKVRSIDRELYR